MKRSANKAERLLHIEQLLLAHPEGLTQAELARRLGVDRSTILRNLADAPKHIYEEPDGRLKIDRRADLINVRLNLHEALAVHLAARLLATRMDRQNRHAAAALRKLGHAIERWAARLSRHVLQAADVMDDAAQRDDPVYLSVLECLTEAWANERKVRIWHQPETGEKVLEYLLSPYFIEPYAIGQTTHIIGKARLLEGRGWSVEKLRTFKIERIRRVEPTTEAYQIPDDFDPRSYLADAWGIWTSEDEPVEVTLRFSSRVARRVQESRWHRSERTEPQPDGSLVWRAQIAEPKEMLPWIRGWGADVEVLAPPWLRKTLEAEVQKMAKVYGVSEMKLQDALIAHRRERDGEEQSLVDHLKGTAELARRFAGKIGLPELGEVMGLAHDFGKASREFQDYLKSATGLKNPDEDDYVDYESRKGKIDHSTAGAQLVYKKCSHLGEKGGFLAQFLALAIASHHSGLIDCLTPAGEDNFGRRIDKEDSATHLSEARGKLSKIEDDINKILTPDVVEHFVQKLQSLKEPNDSEETIAFKLGLLARFLLSCLLDADRLNTADFEFPENSVVRSYGNYVSWDMLIERLEKTFNEFAQAVAQMKEGSQAREVYQLREQVARACREAATKPKGIYQLTVPTGGGKTLASLRFALHHAKHHGMDRVFYVAPYITIIDQNADTLRTILEPESERGRVVLEHHSNFVPEEDTHRRHSLLAENWDAPIVCTTQVQFLEALFGAGTRDTRRMHQLAKAVIILDEVQTVPIRIVHMLNVALRFLAHSCGSTVVLCTATQPPLDRLPDNSYRSLIVKQEQRIILNEVELFKSMQRVEVHYARKDGGMTNDEIVDLAGRALDSEGSVLIVVNTRAMARTLYEQIKVRRLAPTYHLSTNMCPAHRMDVLNTIKEKLAAKEPVICVSTQLIEAGVDIDFGAVIRSLAGLDSVAQSAGRCNRHGLRATPGKVWIVNPQEEDIDQLLDIKIGRDQAQRVLSEFKSGNDFIGLEAITTYYRYYYSSRKDEMDYLVRSSSAVGRDDTLFRLLSTNELSVASYRSSRGVNPPLLLNQSFQSAAREFCVIDSPTIGVIVPYGDEGKTIINALCSASELDNRVKFLRQAQRFSVCLFRRQFEELNRVGAILETNSGIHYLDERYYSKEFGWSHDPVNDMDTLIV